jgi:electron transfer flavoprotein alpha/beta subunit
VSVSNTINRQREGEIRASLEAQRAKVMKMKATRDEGVILQREVENAQRAYDAITAAAHADQPGKPDHAGQHQPAVAGRHPRSSLRRRGWC